MSKRLIRLNPKDAFKLEKLSGIEVSAVLTNGKTYFGILNSVGAAILSLTDTRNHTHNISIDSLYEIVFDQKDTVPTH